jgi:hypothetical protein
MVWQLSASMVPRFSLSVKRFSVTMSVVFQSSQTNPIEYLAGCIDKKHGRGARLIVDHTFRTLSTQATMRWKIIAQTNGLRRYYK